MLTRARLFRQNEGMTVEELRTEKRGQVLRLAAEYGARNARVFGSVARGESKADSDVDFLVDLDTDRTLMDLGGLVTELQDLLHARVDVATVPMLRPKVRARALHEAVPL